MRLITEKIKKKSNLLMIDIYDVLNENQLCLLRFDTPDSAAYHLLSYILFELKEDEQSMGYNNMSNCIGKYFDFLNYLKIWVETIPTFAFSHSSIMRYIQHADKHQKNLLEFLNKIENNVHVMEEELNDIKSRITNVLNNSKDMAYFVVYILGALFVERLYFQQKNEYNLILCMYVFHDLLQLCEKYVDLKMPLKGKDLFHLQEKAHILHLIFLQMHLQFIYYTVVTIKKNIKRLFMLIFPMGKQKNKDIKKTLFDIKALYVKTQKIINSSFHLMTTIATKKSCFRTLRNIFDMGDQIDEHVENIKIMCVIHKMGIAKENHKKKLRDEYAAILQIYDNMLDSLKQSSYISLG